MGGGSATSTRTIRTPFACTPTCMSVGSPQTTKSAQSVANQHLRTVLPRVGAFLVGDTTISSTSAPSIPSARSATASIMAASADFMS